MASGGRGGQGGDRVVKLQILAAVFVPIALILVWLGSLGFFQPPA
jgi:hypothetical protein